MFEHIMVPYDGSGPAGKALDFAMDLAQKYSSKITVIAFVPLTFDYSPDGMSATETVQILKQSATYSLSKIEPKLQRLSLPYEIKVVEGTSVTEAVTSYEEIHGVGLIVMGSRGLGGFKKILLGSAASGISRHSKCPVLIVK